MSKKDNANLFLEIARCKEKLSVLRPRLNESTPANQEYNEVLIKKAVAVQKLKEEQTPLLTKFLKKFKKNKETLICDYFGK